MKLLNFFRKLSVRQVLTIAVILDVLWATLVATFSASVFQILGVAGGAGGTTLGVGTVIGWLLAFIVALLQGAIFMVVFAVFATLILSFFFSK
ncbi:MAG: hypothetical protein Q8T09_01715 [Candidatus Melainabacteria bacterium]|nr:hypothetical protein [Candidatus Melainabacteria bacterium]